MKILKGFGFVSELDWTSLKCKFYFPHSSPHLFLIHTAESSPVLYPPFLALFYPYLPCHLSCSSRERLYTMTRVHLAWWFPHYNLWWGHQCWKTHATFKYSSDTSSIFLHFLIVFGRLLMIRSFVVFIVPYRALWSGWKDVDYRINSVSIMQVWRWTLISCSFVADSTLAVVGLAHCWWCTQLAVRYCTLPTSPVVMKANLMKTSSITESRVDIHTVHAIHSSLSITHYWHFTIPYHSKLRCVPINTPCPPLHKDQLDLILINRGGSWWTPNNSWD